MMGMSFAIFAMLTGGKLTRNTLEPNRVKGFKLGLNYAIITQGAIYENGTSSK